MNREWVVRRAEERDIAGVMQLERQMPTAPHWPESEYRTMLRAGEGSGVKRALFVAEEIGGVLGFVVVKAMGTRPEVEAEIESVAVGAGVRRQGLGGELCGAAMAWSRSEGARTIELEVRAESEAALGLYLGMGFFSIGRRPGYYCEPQDDAIVMRCRLDGE